MQQDKAGRQMHFRGITVCFCQASNAHFAWHGQALILYSAVTCASTPVALRYMYTQQHPPASSVLAAAQTCLAAVILCLVSGMVDRPF
jgi:hypothetical protein